MVSRYNVARLTYLRAAFVVAKNSPAAWADFIEALKQYTMLELERAATAPNSEAQMALGMSRRLLDMRDDFINIEERANNG